MKCPICNKVYHDACDVMECAEECATLLRGVIDQLGDDIAQLQARLESEEAHYIRLYERYRALEYEAIEIVDYADFPRPMKKDMDRIQKKSVDALRALIKREKV